MMRVVESPLLNTCWILAPHGFLVGIVVWFTRFTLIPYDERIVTGLFIGLVEAYGGSNSIFKRG